MADDTVLSAGSGDGDTFRTLDDGTRKWPVSVEGMLTAVGSPNTLSVPVAAALADAAANPTSPLRGSCILVFNGTTWDRARGDTANGLDVDVTRVSGTVVVDGSGVTQPISAAALPLPSGAATSAKQDTANTSLDAIKTAVETIDNAISGSEMQVDIVSSALPNGAATSAKQDTGNTSLASIDTKTPALGQALATASVPVVLPADQVTTLTPPAAITGFATSTKQDTIIGHVDGIESSLADIVTSLQIMDDWDQTNRCAVNLIVGQAGISAGAGVVDVTTPRVTLASDDPAVTALSAIQTSVQLIDNAVSGSALNVIIQSGSVDTVATVVSVGTIFGSSTAHDAVDSGNPHKIGAKATTSLSGLTLVSNGDRTNLFAGVDGVQITRPHCNLEDIVSGNASNTDGTSTSLIAAQGTGIKTYLTTIILTNTSASAIYVEIKDGTTVKLTIPVPANSGAVVSLPVPLGGTANTAWNFDPSAATTTVYCSAVGFKSKV